jgi:ankyrin repeat protein
MIYVKGFLLGLFMFCYAAIFIPAERWQLLAKTQATKNAETSRLIDASKLGDIEQINLLLAHGADVNAADKLGITPLIAASSSLQRSAVELLLSHGANRSAKTNEGFTAYDFAKNQLDDNLASILASKEIP